MRVCRLTWNFPTGRELTHGLGPTFYHISREQAALGLDVHVIMLRKSSRPSYKEVEGVKVHFVNSPYNVNVVRKIAELNRKIGLDVIHAHSTCGLLYSVFRKGIGVPLVVHVHGTTLGMENFEFDLPSSFSFKYSLKSKFRRKISALRQLFFWRKADLLIAVSQAQKEELKTLYGVNDGKIRVVYLGVDPNIFRRYGDVSFLRDRHKLGNKRIILFVGHFGLRKGIPFLIRAMPKILKENPDTVLLCVGGTPKWLGTRLYWDYLKNMIRELSLSNSVRLVGEIPHHELPYYYSMADVFAFPSLYEAFGKVVVEAMACETPVVASKVGGIPEIIHHGYNGLLVEATNVDQLAEAISALLFSKDFARRLGKKARQTVLEKFTWRYTAESLNKVYLEVTENI
ncbi:MAG: glycosyltransferase family 4 protein [Candidatus Bathyarchaeia archaeon]